LKSWGQSCDANDTILTTEECETAAAVYSSSQTFNSNTIDDANIAAGCYHEDVSGDNTAFNSNNSGVLQTSNLTYAGLCKVDAGIVVSSYVATDGYYCPEADLITTETDCEIAASELGFTWTT
jgi:hypothetical protein